MESRYDVGSLFALYASFTAFFSLVKQFYHQLIPEKIRVYIDEKITEWLSKRNILDPNIFTLVIKQAYIDRDYEYDNSLYSACEAYLVAKLRSSSDRLEGCRKLEDEEGTVSYMLTQDEEYVEYVTLDENHQNVKLQWKFVSEDKKRGQSPYENKLFELSFDPKYKDIVLDTFIPSMVMKNYDKMTKEIHLYTQDGMNSRYWNCVEFKHPFTFDALALDPELKKSIVDDLDRFIRRKEFYKKIGKAYKRGYLLYGPPGTGKSSLVAAIANYLKFSVYDLQLASIGNDSSLRDLMMSVNNKSIIVIEDIDCASSLSRFVAPRESKGYTSDWGYPRSDEDDDNNNGDDKGGNKDAVNRNIKVEISLSGILNFIDGLWSSCGDERIIILTTNYKERLDPALLRPGRMDMHIHMSYLKMPGFRTLAYNYLGLSEHTLFQEIEELLERTDTSPAEAAEELIRSEDPDIALSDLVKMMKDKKKIGNKATKGKEGNTVSEPLAKNQESGSKPTSHTEITEDYQKSGSESIQK